MKVMFNLCVNLVMALMAAMIIIGQRDGLSNTAMEECLGAGPVRGVMQEAKSPYFFNHYLTSHGAVGIFAKDKGIAIDLATEHGIYLQVVPAVQKYSYVRKQQAGKREMLAG